MLKAVASNGYLYAVGGYYEDAYGNNGRALSSVEFAPLGADGTVGSWTATASLPAPVVDPGVAVHNGFLYVAGGSSQLNGSASRKVYYATINPDGSVGKWKTTNSLIDKRNQFNLAVNGGYVYAVGGYNGDWTGVFAKVEYASIRADGSLGKWKSTAALPQAEWGAGLAVFNGKIYALGGYTASGTSPAVYFTALNGDGSLAGWTSTAALPLGTTPAGDPIGLWAMGAGANKENIFVVGGALNGGTDGTPVQRVNSSQAFFAQMNPDGSIGSWNTTSPLPAASASLGAAIHNGTLYTVGGTTWGSSETPVNTVQYAKIGERPVVGELALDASGDTLLISGSHFSPETGKNWVLFQVGPDRQDFYYVNPSAATTSSLKVSIPAGPMSGKIRVISNDLQSLDSRGAFRVLVDGSQGCRTVGPPGSPSCIVGGKCNEFVSPGTADCIFPNNFSDNALDLLIVRGGVALRTGISFSNEVTLNGRLLNQGTLATNCATYPGNSCSTLNFSNTSTFTNAASVLNGATINNSGTIISSSPNGIFNGYDYNHQVDTVGTFVNNGTITFTSTENYGFYNGSNSSFTNSGTVNVNGSNPVGFYNQSSTSSVINNAGAAMNIRSGFQNDGTVSNNGTIRICGTGTYTGSAPVPNGTVTTGCTAP